MWSTSFLLKINSPRLYDQLNSFLKSLAFAHMVNLIIFTSQLPLLIRPIQLFSQTNSPRLYNRLISFQKCFSIFLYRNHFTCKHKFHNDITINKKVRWQTHTYTPIVCAPIIVGLTLEAPPNFQENISN
jgi:hypothetical protein